MGYASAFYQFPRRDWYVLGSNLDENLSGGSFSE
jgi:hypothetical protein